MDLESIKNTSNLYLYCFDFLQDPSFFDHFKRRFENTKHTFGKNTIRTFSKEESERLEKLNEKCFQIAEENNVDIFKVGMRVQKLLSPELRKKLY